jgi:hypothetical protein
MRRFFRAPLTWMIIAECAVVAALILVAWHAIAGAAGSSATGSLTFPPVSASPADSALPAGSGPVADGNTRGPMPGLSTGIDFWRLRLGSLNRDEAAFEALEWRITHAAMSAARDYLETVVLPAVKRAEGGGV